METTATNPKPTARAPELPALTGVRFCAALYVVFYHFVSPQLRVASGPLHSFFSAGYCAVGFFFLLSGFVLTYSAAGSPGPSAPGAPLPTEALPLDRRAFWRARFSRIYPAYFFAFLLAAPFQISGSLHVNGWRLGAEKLLLGAGLYLTLLQAWTPWTAWYWNIPAWSLSVEAFFYFCFPFLVSALPKLRPRTCLLAAAGLWILAFTGPAVYSAFWPVAPQPPFSMSQLAIETNPLLRLPEFLCGMLLGRLFSAGYRLPGKLASVLAPAAAAGFVLTLSSSGSVPRLLLANGLLAPVSGLLIFSLAHQSGFFAGILSHPVLKVLGEASYAIYILQFPVSYLFHLQDQTFSALRFSLYLAALIGLSVVTFFGIEQPLRRRLRKRGRSGMHRTLKSAAAPFATRTAVEA